MDTRYPVYIDGESYCAEDIKGNWHTVIIEDNNAHVEMHDSKPERFTECRLMTTEEIYDNDLNFLGEDTIYSKWCMDDAKTLDEAIDELYGFADYIESLDSQGWKIVDGDHGMVKIQIPLKTDNKTILEVNPRG